MKLHQIRALLLDPNITMLARKRAHIALSMWMRFPNDINERERAIQYAVLSYARQFMPKRQIRNLDRNELEFVFYRMTVSKLHQNQNVLFWPESDFLNPHFRYYENEEDSFQLISRIIKNIIISEERINVKSIYAAYDDIMDSYEVDRRRSRKFFQRIWNKYKNSSFLIYIDHEFFDRSIMVNPKEDNFQERLERNVSTSGLHERFFDFFDESISSLKRKMHKRAFNSIISAIEHN